MRRLRILSMILAVLPLTGLSNASTSPTPPLPLESGFTAEYEIKKTGLTVGHTTLELTADRGRLVYHSNSQPVEVAAWFFGDHRIREASIMRAAQDRLMPLEYRYTHEGDDKNRNEHYTFDWDNNQVRVNYRGQHKTIAVPPGTLDNFSLQVQLMRDLRTNRTPLSYPLVNRGKLKTYAFTRDGPETVTVPAGTYSAIKVIRQKDDEDQTAYTTWYAPTLDYLPVMVEKREGDDVVLRMQLEDLKWPTEKPLKAGP